MAALKRYKDGALAKDTDRKSLHKVFDDIRNLRNRAYHLEPIFCQADLWTVYVQAVKYLKILHPQLAYLMASIDRFEATYNDGNGWLVFKDNLYVHYGLDKLESETETDSPIQAISLAEAVRTI